MDAGAGPPDEGGVGRLRRLQERYEPLITRVLLLAIFTTGLIAQFVKPVGDALEGKAYLGGALLSLVGYVLYGQVRELSAAVEVPAGALGNASELGTFVSEAFQARKVEIGFLGYTGETLYNALYHRLEDLFDNPGPTRRVSIRMLVHDFGLPMTVSSRVVADGTPQDGADFRKRMEEHCREYDGILRLPCPGQRPVVDRGDGGVPEAFTEQGGLAPAALRQGRLVRRRFTVPGEIEVSSGSACHVPGLRRQP